MTATERHPSTRHLMRYFSYEHLPPHLQPISRLMHDTAAHMVTQLPDSPELTAGLRKMLEAKDCFVRAGIAPGGDRHG